MMEKISIDFDLKNGQAYIKSNKLPARMLAQMIAKGHSPKAIMQKYPYMDREDVIALEDYAKFLGAEEIVLPLKLIEEEES
jgi:uncharacterized protein (DUF433 family)